jgi:hypothetical protein
LASLVANPQGFVLEIVAAYAASLAGLRPIARLVRRDESRPPAAEATFGFEIDLPPAAGELPVRALAYLI